jgi:hypothetical protein
LQSANSVYVTFELVNDEFPVGDGILDQGADGDNADYLIVFLTGKWRTRISVTSAMQSSAV